MGAGDQNPRRNGWHYNATSARLEMYYMGTLAGYITASGIFSAAATALGSTADDALFTLGTDADVVYVERSSTLNANTALTGVLVGTPVTPAVHADSLILGLVTADADYLVATNHGGNSHAAIFVDADVSTKLYDPVNGTEVADVSDTGAIFSRALRMHATNASHMGLGAAQAVTLAAGVATITKPYARLESSSGTTDTLSSITYTGAVDGDLLLLVPDADDTITIDDTTIWLGNGADSRALAPNCSILLRYDGVNSAWMEVLFNAAAVQPD